jgi:O-antigen ligase
VRIRPHSIVLEFPRARTTETGLAVLLALAPLPFGSDRPWAVSLAALIVAALLVQRSFLNRWVNVSASVASISLVAPYGAFYSVVLAWGALPLMGMMSGHDSAAPFFLVDRSSVVEALLRLLMYGAVFTLAFLVGHNEESVNVLLHTVIASGTVYACYGIMQNAIGDHLILWYHKWAYLGVLTSTFVNRNHFATFDGLCLLTTLTLLLRRLGRASERSSFSRMHLLKDFFDHGLEYSWLAVCSIALFLALILTHSRAGIASVVLGIIILFGMALGRRQRVTRLLSGFFLAIVTAMAVGGRSLLAVDDLQRISSLAVLHDERFAIVDMSVKAIVMSPWFGWGLGSFGLVFARFRPPGIEGYYDAAHNQYLELAIELGLPAAVVMTLLLIVLTWQNWRHRYSKRGLRAPCALAVSASFVVGIHSLLDFSLRIPAVAMLYAALLGLGLARIDIRGSARRLRRPREIYISSTQRGVL